MRPLLAAAITDLSQIKYPVFVSFKLDGIRAIKIDGQLLSRTQKPIPNDAIQNKFSLLLPNGWDGELICGLPTSKDVYRKTVSKVMTYAEDTKDVSFFAFDIFGMPLSFKQRYERLYSDGAITRLHQFEISDKKSLLLLEAHALASGYEGLMLRNPNSLYKQGRSTINEGILLKLKRFTDSEAQVTNFEEQYHNANPATLDERGYTKRSSHQNQKLQANTLGALVVLWQGDTLRIGTGFTSEERQHIWSNKDQYLGRWAKFKYLPIGIKDLPRHPVFLGWRSPDDL